MVLSTKSHLTNFIEEEWVETALINIPFKKSFNEDFRIITKKDTYDISNLLLFLSYVYSLSANAVTSDKNSSIAAFIGLPKAHITSVDH